MPIYGFTCPACEAAFDLERPLAAAAEPAPCPVCGTESPRAISSPRFLFKGDPRDNRPFWHNHDGYSHQHAPRRGRHRTPNEDH
jgi:putative FmdB family regulatory protein